MEIPLTQGKVALADDSDAGLLAGYSWHAARKDLPGGRVVYYAKATAYPGRRTMLMHRLIAGVPTGVEVDHIDGDTLNNRRSNLRAATRGQNMRNTRKRLSGVSQYKGVRFHADCRRPWSAVIEYEGRRLRVGSLTTEEEAARAYDRLAREAFGEFACLNFPEPACEGMRGV